MCENQTDTFLEQFLIADRMVAFSSTLISFCVFIWRVVMDVNVAPSISAVLSAVLSGSFAVNRCCELRIKKSKIEARFLAQPVVATAMRGAKNRSK